MMYYSVKNSNSVRRRWKEKSVEEILSILEAFLIEKVKSGEIRKINDLKTIDAGLWAAIKNYTPYGPAGCFRILGYGSLVKSDKRKGISDFQEQLGNRPMKVLDVDDRLSSGRLRSFIRYECTIDGCGYRSDWKAFNNIKKGTGCPRCSGKEPLTNEIHDERLKLYFDGKIIRLENIKNARNKTCHHCTICRYEWSPYPYSIAPKSIKKSKPRGCPKCANKIPLTNEEHDNRLQHHHSENIKRIEDIRDARTPIEHQCLICDKTFPVEPYNIAPCIESRTRARGCPYCSGRAPITNEMHDERLKYWHGDSIIRIEDVKYAKDPILHKCLNHEYEWLVSPNKIAPPINSWIPTKCPLCCNIRVGMGLEVQKILGEILKKINPNIIDGACSEIKERSLIDGYVRGIEPDYSIGNIFIDSKLSIGAVFSRDDKTSHEKYSPYGSLINVVFEPWKGFESRAVIRGKCNILHVSALLNELTEKSSRMNFIKRIENILLLDPHNLENGVIKLFKKVCTGIYLSNEKNTFEESMVKQIKYHRYDK